MASDRTCLEWDAPAQIVREGVTVEGWLTASAKGGQVTRPVWSAAGRWCRLTLSIRGPANWRRANTLRVFVVRGPLRCLLASLDMSALSWDVADDGTAEASIAFENEPGDGFEAQITSLDDAAAVADSELLAGLIVGEVSGPLS